LPAVVSKSSVDGDRASRIQATGRIVDEMHGLRQRESAGRKILRALRRCIERERSRRRSGTAAEQQRNRAAPGCGDGSAAEQRNGAASCRADSACGCADRCTPFSTLRTSDSSRAAA
jgi:hypothetical protein